MTTLEKALARVETFAREHPEEFAALSVDLRAAIENLAASEFASLRETLAPTTGKASRMRQARQKFRRARIARADARRLTADLEAILAAALRVFVKSLV